MFYNLAVFASLVALEVIVMFTVARATQDAQARPLRMAAILAVGAMATFLGIWVSPVRGSSAGDGLRPFVWLGLANTIAFAIFMIVSMIVSRQKYGKPRSSL